MQGSDRREEALGWVVRTNDPDFADWDEFTQWLERHPDNAAIYHELLDSERLVTPLIAEAAPEQSTAPRLRVARFGWLSAAAIAAFFTAFAAPRFLPVEQSTLPGEVRIVSLGGQDQLVMNGGTRVRLAGFNRRDIRLEEGQILLRLHDPEGGTVEVESGDLRLVDIGTVFEVSRSRNSTRVIVSEGAVVADPAGAALRLNPGMRLDTADGARRLQAIPADRTAAGSFARGQLVYNSEPIDRVIEDLRRSTGIQLAGDPAAGAMRFTGTLSVQEVKRDPRSLEPLLGITMERAGQGWRVRGRV